MGKFENNEHKTDTVPQDPEMLEIRADVYGRSCALWHYRHRPEGLHQAKISELRRGMPVLYRAQLGKNAGDWYSDYVRESTWKFLCQLIAEGKEVLIR